MEIRIRNNEWQRQIRRLLAHPVTGLLALVALAVMTAVALVTSEARLIRSPHVPVVFGPK